MKNEINTVTRAFPPLLVGSKKKWTYISVTVSVLGLGICKKSQILQIFNFDIYIYYIPLNDVLMASQMQFILP